MKKVSNFNGLDIYIRLINYVKHDWGMLAVGLVGFGIYAATQMGSAWWLKEFVDTVENKQFDMRGFLALSIMAIFLTRGLGWMVGTYGFAYVARSLVTRLRLQMFDHLLVLPSAFYQRQPSSQLTAKLVYNAEQVTGAATGAFKTVVREGLSVIGLFGYMLYLNWKLTLLFIAVLPAIGLVVTYTATRLRRLSQNIQGSVGDISSAASEAIQGYQVVRIFGGAEAERKRFNAAAERNRRQYMKMVVTDAITTPVVQMLVAFSVALLTYIAMSPEFLSAMSTGAFIAFVSTGALMAKPIRHLTEVNGTIQKGVAAADSFFTLFDEPAEQDIGREVLVSTRGHIAFKNVTFTYPGNESPTLHNISLDIPAGKTLALVGKSGSGKSTMSSLIPRFFDVQSGRIELDGKPIEQYTLKSLRSHIALVNQHVVLFEGTIAENIAYGALENASTEAIEAAAKAAYVMDFAQDLPNGLQTMIGENGLKLSGGQRQRIAIARAILKDAPILILDEATSALDNASERHIQKALENLMQNRTTIIIAHRLSTIEKTDQIVVMNHGKVIERGNHQALLSNMGPYYKLHQSSISETNESK